GDRIRGTKVALQGFGGAADAGELHGDALQHAQRGVEAVEIAGTVVRDVLCGDGARLRDQRICQQRGRAEKTTHDTDEKQLGRSDHSNPQGIRPMKYSGIARRILRVLLMLCEYNWR